MNPLTHVYRAFNQADTRAPFGFIWDRLAQDSFQESGNHYGGAYMAKWHDVNSDIVILASRLINEFKTEDTLKALLGGPSSQMGYWTASQGETTGNP